MGPRTSGYSSPAVGLGTHVQPFHIFSHHPGMAELGVPPQQSRMQTSRTTPPLTPCQPQHPVLHQQWFSQQKNQTRPLMISSQSYPPASAVPQTFLCSYPPTSCKPSNATSSFHPPPASQEPAWHPKESYHSAGNRKNSQKKKHAITSLQPSNTLTQPMAMGTAAGTCHADTPKPLRGGGRRAGRATCLPQAVRTWMRRSRRTGCGGIPTYPTLPKDHGAAQTQWAAEPLPE